MIGFACFGSLKLVARQQDDWLKTFKGPPSSLLFGSLAIATVGRYIQCQSRPCKDTLPWMGRPLQPSLYECVLYSKISRAVSPPPPPCLNETHSSVFGGISLAALVTLLFVVATHKGWRRGNPGRSPLQAYHSSRKGGLLSWTSSPGGLQALALFAWGEGETEP